MLTRAEAVQVVNDKLKQKSVTVGHELVLLEKETKETSFGWVFFYDSKKFIETGNMEFAIAGNGPVIVNKNNGEIVFHGSRKSAIQLIAEYEDKIRTE